MFLLLRDVLKVVKSIEDFKKKEVKLLMDWYLFFDFILGYLNMTICYVRGLNRQMLYLFIDISNKILLQKRRRRRKIPRMIW